MRKYPHQISQKEQRFPHGLGKMPVLFHRSLRRVIAHVKKDSEDEASVLEKQKSRLAH